MAENMPVEVPRLDLVNDVDTNIDLYTSIQDRLQRVGEEFSTWAQSHWGKEASNLLDSAPGINDMDHTWEPVRALGKGSFGIVGLWQKTDSQGVVKDSIAIKETARIPQSSLALERDPRLAREAVIMKQLNDAETDTGRSVNHILRLRNFKNLPTARRWRFYLEYGEYGDFFTLLYSYMAWNAFFPEEFLWHVFHSFARAAVVMEEGPFTQLESEKPEPTKWSVTHFDIKPDNVYMAKPDESELFKTYPTIKVADFGLAELTGEDDKHNPYFFRSKGTDGYKPPVSILS